MTCFWKIRKLDFLILEKNPEILRWSVHSPPQDILTRIGLRGIPVVKLINSPPLPVVPLLLVVKVMPSQLIFPSRSLILCPPSTFISNWIARVAILFHDCSVVLCTFQHVSCLQKELQINQEKRSKRAKYDFWNNVVAKAHQIWFSQSLLWLGWEGIKG